MILFKIFHLNINFYYFSLKSLFHIISFIQAFNYKATYYATLVQLIYCSYLIYSLSRIYLKSFSLNYVFDKQMET
ncbi:hypothetical protein CH426_25870 [Klebsiella aerogenes]|nr:hypothetical protein CH426_25870 [Klebsiella aerogenes]